MKRKGDNRLAAEGWIMSQRQKGHFVVAGEGIWRSQENGDVVFRVHSYDRGWKQARRTIGAADQDVGLAAVLKSLQDMGGRKEIAMFVNEKGIAEETVVVTARGWRLVELINDRANRSGKSGVVGKVPGRRTSRQAAE